MIAAIRRMLGISKPLWCVYRYKITVRCEMRLPIPAFAGEAPKHVVTQEISWHSPVTNADDLPAHVLSMQGVVPGTFHATQILRCAYPQGSADDLTFAHGRVALVDGYGNNRWFLAGVAYGEHDALRWIVEGDTSSLRPLVPGQTLPQHART